jgi:hypothetical protein
VVKYVIFDAPLAIFGLLIAIKEKIRGESDVIKKEPLLLLGTIICLIENSVSLVYVAYLYHAYYQKDLFGILGKLGIL